MLSQIDLIRLMQPELCTVKVKKLIYLKRGKLFRYDQ